MPAGILGGTITTWKGGSMATQDPGSSLPRSSGYEKRGGQVLMGPRQPRPPVMDKIPAPPPRGKK